MRKFYLTLLSAALLLGAEASAASSPLGDFSFQGATPETLVINNRVLLKLNGKAITVLDVVRKMDLMFYRQYPEYASSDAARYQFYTSAWRTILAAVIDDYLIMADAEEKKITVNDGEVRQELETLFGPDVVLNLDKAGMTLDEAFDLLKTELTVQRMTSMMVRSKAMTEVQPAGMKKRYETVVADNPAKNYLTYRVLSIRGEGHESAAQEAHSLLANQHVPFEEIVARVQEKGLEASCSEDFRQLESDLSLSYRAVLATLSVGNVSAPISNDKVSRLFCLKNNETVEPPSFQEVLNDLKNELTQEAFARRNGEYREKLRDYYGLSDEYLSHVIPQNLKPFALR